MKTKRVGMYRPKHTKKNTNNKSKMLTKNTFKHKTLKRRPYNENKTKNVRRNWIDDFIYDEENVLGGGKKNKRTDGAGKQNYPTFNESLKSNVKKSTVKKSNGKKSAAKVATPAVTTPTAEVIPTATTTTAEVAPTVTTSTAEVAPTVTTSTAEVAPTVTTSTAEVAPTVTTTTAEVARAEVTPAAEVTAEEPVTDNASTIPITNAPNPDELSTTKETDYNNSSIGKFDVSISYPNGLSGSPIVNLIGTQGGDTDAVFGAISKESETPSSQTQTTQDLSKVIGGKSRSRKKNNQSKKPKKHKNTGKNKTMKHRK